MQIRIQDHSVTVHRHAEVAGQVDRQRGGADPPTHSGDHHEAAALRAFGHRSLAGNERAEMASDFVVRQWLRQVILSSKVTGNLMVEIYAVHSSYYQHTDVRLDHIR